MDLKEYGDLNLLTSVLYGEARSESVLGKLAVALVIKNRVKSSRWPNSYADVILQPKQFSCFNETDPNYEVVLKAVNSSLNWLDRPWRECRGCAQMVIGDWVNDFTKGANHYHTTACNPYWTKNEGFVLLEGNHKFYKL